MSKLKAIGKRVLIELTKAETITEGGIIIPELVLKNSGEDKPNKGIVVSVGEEVSNINEGDFIFFNKFTGAEIEYEKFKYLMVKLEDIYAIVK